MKTITNSGSSAGTNGKIPKESRVVFEFVCGYCETTTEVVTYYPATYVYNSIYCHSCGRLFENENQASTNPDMPAL